MAKKSFWDDAEIIYSYSRKQAIEDGVLADISKLAKEAGIKVPTAITSGLFEEIKPPKRSHEDITGRLWDILNVFVYSAKRLKTETDTFLFTVKIGKRNKKIRAVMGPGDNMEPVLTLMLPDED